MSVDLAIDIDACHSGASDLAELAAEIDQASSTVKSDAGAVLDGYDGYRFGVAHETSQVLFRLNLRAHRRALLIDDLSQFIEANTLSVEEADEEARAGFEQTADGLITASATDLAGVTLEAGQYSSSDYYELSGEERPSPTAEDGAMPTADGDAIA